MRIGKNTTDVQHHLLDDDPSEFILDQPEELENGALGDTRGQRRVEFLSVEGYDGAVEVTAEDETFGDAEGESKQVTNSLPDSAEDNTTNKVSDMPVIQFLPGETLHNTNIQQIHLLNPKHPHYSRIVH